jgi:hypothetical protein
VSWRAALLAIVVAAQAGAQEPVVPKLADRPPTPATVVEDSAATPLPAMISICIDRAMQRCWTAMVARECTIRAQGAEVYATVAAQSTEAGAQLRACWDNFKQ